jgi:hypothetical protein
MMTSYSDDHFQDAAPHQQKWVTPKISLMGAGDTDGSAKLFKGNENSFPFDHGAS